jgi:hypothetical protein
MKFHPISKFHSKNNYSLKQNQSLQVWSLNIHELNRAILMPYSMLLIQENEGTIKGGGSPWS